MRKAGWQIVVGLLVFLGSMLVSFLSENPINSQLWSSFSVITAVFTIHQQVVIPKKGDTHE